MTPRERWEAVLEGQPVDRIPMDFWSTPEVLSRLLDELGCSEPDELWRELLIDRTHSVAPMYIGPDLPGGNIWRYETTDQEVADGRGIYQEVANHPLGGMTEVEELEDFPWPSPDWFDYSNIPDDLARLGEWPVQAGHYEPFLVYCAMRGLEKAFIDLVETPEFVDKALEKIFQFHYEHNRRIFEAAGPNGGILYTYVAEDLGSQRGLLMGVDTIERFLIPRMQTMIELAHSYGIKAFHHDDGAIRPILPRLVEIGIDILNPIQWRCPGMDREGLKRDFGDVLVFHGGVDNQVTLPYGTPDEVRQEVRDNLRILGKGGGYILAPCHNIQPVTPTENILAMYEAARDFVP